MDKKKKEAKIEIEGFDEQVQMENDTNMLVLPGGKKEKKKEKTQHAANPAKKKLNRKEKQRLEKVLEKKKKLPKLRSDLLEKLAAFQVKPSELQMYNSVKDIGKKEKKKIFDDLNTESGDKSIVVNSILGSNKKRKRAESEEEARSEDTDDMSTDSEIDEESIQKALQNAQHAANSQKEKIINENLNKLQAEIAVRNKGLESDDEESAAQKETKSNRKTKYVHVERREEIKESRSKLPIITEEQLIMERIHENDIVIICGETGSGKTTQVPQFLYEAGYAADGQMIGITEPRRVAAISMSKRVNDEMNFEEAAGVVSYQIRYEGTHSPATKIKFMTDGVLLKEVQTDFMLSKYSVIIIDEAHERSVYTDILIGLLSRIVPLRNKKNNQLKLIIMSATLRVEDFTENRRLFKSIPPAIKVDSRQYPVSVHFNKHTYEDYLAEAFRKVCKIHRRLPEGGILVFVTGQQEVNVLCAKLRKTFPKNGDETSIEADEASAKEPEVKKRREKKKKSNANKEAKLEDAPKINLNNYSTKPLEQELEMNELDNEDEDLDAYFDLENCADDIDDDDDDDEEEEEKEGDGETGNNAPKRENQNRPLYVLPLYSLLPSEKQIRVFEKVPENCRLCVVATNVAETSLTIPNVKYVVDCGKIKMKFYDKVTGVSKFKIVWTSKASADQRSGRAGRTSPGHCYRLYSSAAYNDEFPKFTEPEIARKPVEDLILQMKDLGIDRILNFPFPTPPDETTLKVAENLLMQLGAIEADKAKVVKQEQVTKITPLGKLMACFPINPRYSKMLTLAARQPDANVLGYIICLICGLSVPELFSDGETVVQPRTTTTTTTIKDEPVKLKYSQMRQNWISGVPGSHTMLLGDLMLLLVALGAVEYEQHSAKSEATCRQFCEQYGIRFKGIVEARKLRKQLVNTANIVFSELNLSIDPLLSPPSQEQAKLIRQIVLSGMVDRIAKRYEHVINDKEGKELKHAYQGLLLAEPIFIHPSSVLFKELPEFVCYVEMVETSKMYMKGVCALEPSWLPLFLANQCSFEKPVVNEADAEYEGKKPRFDSEKGVVVCHRESTFGRVMWKIKAVEVEFPASLELFKWFARFFLEGEVLDSLKKYAPVMLASPATMLKSWAKLQPRTEALLNAFINENCTSRSKLLEIWSKRSEYLLNEYLLWIPESLHFELKLNWPPIKK